jgi:hypothetical protein
MEAVRPDEEPVSKTGSAARCLGCKSPGFLHESGVRRGAEERRLNPRRVRAAGRAAPRARTQVGLQVWCSGSIPRLERGGRWFDPSHLDQMFTGKKIEK